MFIIIITFLQTCEEFYVCVTHHLLGVYCDGVFLYLHVMANFVYAGSLLFKCVWYIFSACNIDMSNFFILRFLSKGSVCA